MDIWVSKDGADWRQVSDSHWNAATPEEIKYDFDALVVKGGKRGQRPSIFTFGGDRETFDFTDLTNYLNVDNDVWRFSPPLWMTTPALPAAPKGEGRRSESSLRARHISKSS